MVLRTQPKDHGYAWMVLLGAILQMVLSIGIVKTSGLLFVTFQERFGSSSSMTSLVSTVQNISFSVTSLFVMAVGIKITTCRNLVFVGSILLCTAFIVTSHAENISVLLFSQGVLQGIAVAFNESSLLVMLSHYFEKRRGFANSISSSGCCIGGLLFAPLIAKLLSIYGYKGCLLIIAGILLNGCISGALFRPISFYALQNKDETNEHSDDEAQKGFVIKRVDDEILEHYEQHKTKNSRKFDKSPKLLEDTNLKSRDIERSMSPMGVNLNTGKIKLGQLGKPLLPSTKSLNECTGTNDKYNHLNRRQRTVSESVVIAVVDAMSNSSVAKYVSSDYIAYSSVDLSVNYSETTGKDKSNDNETSKQNMVTLKSIFRNCLAIFDYELFKRPVFVCLLIAAGCICSGTLLSQVFFAPYARDIGVSVDDVATLITIYNVIDVCARILLSFIADRGWLRRSTMAAIATVIVSLTAHLLRFYSSYSLLLVYIVILSLVSGVYFSLFVVILVDYMTLEKLHSCIGLVSLCHGFSVAGGFYLIGYLRDVTGSYLVPYHVLGIMTLIGAILLFLLPVIEKIEKSR